MMNRPTVWESWTSRNEYCVSPEQMTVPVTVAEPVVALKVASVSTVRSIVGGGGAVSMVMLRTPPLPDPSVWSSKAIAK